MNASCINWMASRTLVFYLIITSSLCAVLSTAPAVANETAKQHQIHQARYTLNLPQQTVAESLNDLATHTGAQFLFSYQLAKSRTANPVNGHFTLLEATNRLLQNTGLKSDLVDGVLTISLTENASYPANQNGKGKRMNINKRKNLLATFIAVFAAGATTQGAVAQDGEAATAQSGIDEIIVTATRRATSLQDTALSIAAIGGEEISRRNLSEMNDYLRTVPGVSFIDLGVGQNAAVIRGVASSPQFEGAISGPGVEIYYGEVPLGGLGLIGGNADIKMIDLNRVEVLRGPQGTLFGSGSLSGAIRNIPNAPDLNNLEGSLKTSYSNTGQNGGTNSKFEGVVNIPVVEDVLALRAVAYRHDNSGFIKNIAATQLATGGESNPGVLAEDNVTAFGGAELYKDVDDIGNTTTNGGRLSALWQPTDNLGVTLSHIYQKTEQEGIPYVQINTGGYTQVSLQFDLGNAPALEGKKDGFTDEVSITNLLFDYDLDWANLMSSTTWADEEGTRNRESSGFIGGGLPLSTLWLTDTDAFYQELRLSSALDGPLQYIVGLYYSDVTNNNSGQWYGSDSALTFFGRPLGNPLLDDSIENKGIEQLSFYGELSYQLTDELELTLGARRFDYERESLDAGDGVFGADRYQAGKTEESGTSLKLNLSYMLNEDSLLYAQYTEGFRLGSTNFPVPLSLCDVNDDGILDGTNAPITDGFDADTTKNLEFGVKLSFLDNRAQVNASVYQMDWDGIPLFIQSGALPGLPQTCLNGLTANAGDARSRGVELETTYQITEGIRASLGGAYTNAEFVEGFPEFGASKGDRLPSSPEYSVNVGLLYEFEIAGQPAHLQGDYAYVGDYYNFIGEQLAGLGGEAGDYGEVNMSFGMTFDSLSVEFFGRNLTDEDALTHHDISVPDSRAYRLRPRTLGLNIGYQF